MSIPLIVSCSAMFVIFVNVAVIVFQEERQIKEEKMVVKDIKHIMDHYGAGVVSFEEFTKARNDRELKSYFQRIFDEALEQGVELTSVADVVNDTPYICEYAWGKVKEVREL